MLLQATDLFLRALVNVIGGAAGSLFRAVKTVVLVGLRGMQKIGCSGQTRLDLHVPSAS